MGRDIHEDGRGEDEEDVGEDTELLSTASLEGLDFDRWDWQHKKKWMVMFLGLGFLMRD